MSILHRAMIGLLAAGWNPKRYDADGALPLHRYVASAGTYQAAGGAVAVADGDVVGQWQDQAAAADHVAQGTADYKALLKLAVLNGRPVIRLDGTNDFLQGAFTNGGAISQPYTSIVVAKLDDSLVADPGSNRYLLESDDITNRMGHAYIRSTLKFSALGASTLPGPAGSSNWSIWLAEWNNLSGKLYINGGTPETGAVGTHAPDGITIGALYTGAGNFWMGDVAEILLYAGVKSVAAKNQLGRYLNRTYGIAWGTVS